MSMILGIVAGVVSAALIMFLVFEALLAITLFVFASFDEKLKRTNDPKNPEKWHLFTTVQQIQVKTIMRREHVVGYIMYSPELVLRRDRAGRSTIEDVDFAEVIDRNAYKGDDLLYWSHWSVGWIRRYIYKKFGMIWVGIPPFQQVYHREFDSRHLKTTVVDGKVVRTIESNQAVTHTDHLRVGEFDRPFAALDVELQGNLKVSVWGEATYRVTNVFKALWKVTRFELRIDNLVAKSLNDYLATQDIKNVLTRTSETKQDIEKEMLRVLQATLEEWGVRIVRFHIVEIEDALSSDQRIALTAKWVAEQKRDARIEEAKGESSFLEQIGQKLAENPALAQAYTQIEIAKAAAGGKGSSTFMMGGQQQSLEAAILAELQRIRGGLEKV